MTNRQIVIYYSKRGGNMIRCSKGTNIIIPAEVVIAGAMYANNRLEISFHEIKKMKDFLDISLEHANINGYASWDKEEIKRLSKGHPSFLVGEGFVNCIGGQNRIKDILSYCDMTTLDFIIQYKDYKFDSRKEL